jgi:hypothetical protein
VAKNIREEIAIVDGKYSLIKSMIVPVETPLGSRMLFG